MNLEDIIRMARSAGCHDNGEEFRFIEFRYLERFAAFVAAAERNECAALVDANAMACHSPIYRSLLQSNADAIRARGKDPMPLFDDWPGGWQK